MRGTVRLLEYMYERIKNSGVRLNEIFMSFSDPALEKSGFLAELRESGAPAFSGAVRMLGLPPECASELELLGGTLGTLCTDEQLSELKSASAELRRRYDDCVKELPSKQKVTRAVWGLAGALIALLLI